MILKIKIRNQKEDLSYIDNGDLILSIKTGSQKKLKISFFNNNCQLEIFIMYYL